MDQLKEFFRQAVKYRFWIAIGVAAILPIIAFFVGTGGLAEQEKTETAKITGAYSEVKNFVGKPIENNQWKDAVVAKTDILAADVNKSHEKLYARQAGLLDWPKPVAAKFEAWGPYHPKDVDPQMITDVIQTYTEVYPEYVNEVYKTFTPFDYDTGTGIVAGPSKNTLLRPSSFREENLPSLGDVWSAQRKLWIQRTMLDVVAKVNAKAKAKDWDSAPVKQILMLEVANPIALDQRTSAKPPEEQLVDAPPILAPGQTAPDAAAATTTAATAGARNGSESMGSMGAMGGAAAPTGPEPVQFVKSPAPDQYYIVPVAMAVYVEQDKVNDFLVEFRNSPMSIRIYDIDWRQPRNPVKKPRKGLNKETFAGSMGEGRGRGGMSGGLAGGEPGVGGGNSMSLSEGYGQSGAAKGYNASMTKGARGSMGGGMNAAKKSQGREGGKDVGKENLQKLRDKTKKASDKAKEKEDEDEEEPTLSNQYFNVVQIEIKGQARFYMPPPKSSTPPMAPTPAAGDPAKEAAKADPAKPDAPKAEPAKDAPKADDAKAAAPAPAKADAIKPESAKDASKSEPAKDAPKAEAPKDPAGTPPDAKGDAAKPKEEPSKPDAEKPKDAGDKPKS